MSKGQAAKSGGNKGGANGSNKERGGFVLGLIVGLLLGLAVALGVALYISKVPVPFINKVPQRTAEQDAEETAHNKDWDPNAPLASSSARVASGVVTSSAASAPAATPAVVAPTPATPVATTPTSTASPSTAPATKPADKSADAAKAASALAGVDPYVYYIQVGAFTKPEDAEQQRARLALQGFIAKVMERDQSGHPVYRVRLGPLDTRADADDQAKKVQEAGVEASLVRVAR